MSIRVGSAAAMALAAAPLNVHTGPFAQQQRGNGAMSISAMEGCSKL
jgi:hypothetical protein